MIRSLPTHIAPPARTRTANGPVKSTVRTWDFRKLVTPAATNPAGTVAKPSATTPKPPDELPHLGPFTGDPNMHPATPPPKPPDPITSSPYLPPGYPGTTDLMNKTQHENTMNDWLQNYTRWSNDKTTQIYQQALANWQLNDDRCRELGMESPPKPTPPSLDPIQPMPSGYWFKT